MRRAGTGRAESEDGGLNGVQKRPESVSFTTISPHKKDLTPWSVVAGALDVLVAVALEVRGLLEMQHERSGCGRWRGRGTLDEAVVAKDVVGTARVGSAGGARRERIRRCRRDRV